MILYILLSGSPPFNGSDDKEILKKVKAGKFSFSEPIWKKRSPECKDLIEKLLTVDPKKRPTAIEALQHRWIKEQVVVEFDEQMATQAFANLKNFRVEQKMQEAAIVFIVC